MNYEKREDIRERSFKFAIRVISLCRSLPMDNVNRILANQVIRSSTSIGANLEEARGARTKAEFTNCTNIAKREARETHYWLKIIHESSIQKMKNRTEEIIQEANEIVSILTSSVKTLDRKN